jgi:preprotein translocase subunit SecG
MLKKLLKYDLIFMYKGLIIFYILSILSAICTRIFDNIGDEMIWVIITKICSGVTISMLFNIIINNSLRIWARFSKNFYGDESYLTHTLPVTKSTHYASKFLTLLITVTSSVVVMILTLLIAYVESAEQLKVFIESFVFENAKVLDVIVLVVILLLELIHIIQLGYTGMIFGNRRVDKKIIWSLVYGFIGYLITQIISAVYLFGMALVNSNVKEMFFTAYGPGAEQMGGALEETLKILVYGIGVLFVVITIVLYFINNKMLNKGVNVE